MLELVGFPPITGRPGQRTGPENIMENRVPQITVIIPTYNRVGFLEEAVNSVLDQTCQDFELIVVDDGSTDHTEDLAEKFGRAQFLRLEKNSGVSHARNYGLSFARGRYICFLDSDDLWKKSKLKNQVCWMESHPDCQISYTDEVWVRKGVRVNPMNKHKKYGGDIFRYCLPLCIVSPSSAMLRTSLLKEVGGFDESLEVCEDYDLWLRISSRHPFHFIRDKLIVKRGGHNGQLSQKHWGMDRFRVTALEKLLRDNSLSEEKRRMVCASIVGKCEILVTGFAKRGKEKEADHYRSIIKRVSLNGGKFSG